MIKQRPNMGKQLLTKRITEIQYRKAETQDLNQQQTKERHADGESLFDAHLMQRSEYGIASSRAC